MSRNAKQVRSGVPIPVGRRGEGETIASRIRSSIPTALVLAGVAATALWTGFLTWCVVGVVRWTLG